MNIGIVTTWFERGAGYVSKQYKELLEAAGETVFIYARGGELYAKGDPAWDSSVVWWSKRYGFPVSTYVEPNEFKRWLVINKIDVVLFNEQTWLQPVLICKDLNVRTGLYVDYYTEDTIRHNSIFDFLICNTKRHYSVFKWHEQAYYIPWGTDVRLFNVSKARVRSEKIRFFNSAGMNPYRKGVDILINSFVIAQRDKLFQAKAQLIIHTQKPLLAFFGQLEGQKETLKNIEYLLERGDLLIIEETASAPGLYHLGDIYVYPSRLDGIGLTIAEALSCSMPIIVPDDAPMNEFLPAKGSSKVKVNKFFCRADGYYWPQNEVDVDDLAEKLKFYCYNESSISLFSDMAREYTVENLDWSKNKDQLVDIFRNAKQLDVDQKTRRSAVRLFSDRYPFIHKYEWFYRFLYRFKPILKSILRQL